MIQISEQWYGELVGELNTTRLQEIELASSVGDPTVRLVPKGGEGYGKARERGLQALLRSRNVYPVGNNCCEIRCALRVFDSMDATVNNTVSNWFHQRETAIRYYWLIHDHREDLGVANHVILADKRRLDETFKANKIWAAALIIFRVAYGWHIKPKGMKRLWEMAELPSNKLVHNMLVKPLIVFFCLEMDPHNYLDPCKILTTDLSRLEGNIKQKSKAHGNWSQDEAIRRIGLGDNDTESITFKDGPMISGIEYKFARLFSLIINGFERPWNRHKEGEKRAEKCWLTDLEKRTYYLTINEMVQARYGQPTYPS